MFSRILKWFKYFVVSLLLVTAMNNFAFADKSLAEEEKSIFYIANSLGMTSFYMSDVYSNEDIMGLAILNSKLQYLERLVQTQAEFAKKMDLSKDTKNDLNKFVKEVDDSYVDLTFNRKKFLVAHEDYKKYMEHLRSDLKKLYGPKYTWLFDAVFLASFTNASMSSEYKNKLVLLEFGHLVDYIPYDLPTSVVSSLSNVVTVRDANLTPTQVDLLKEASQNIVSYFTNPETYAPPSSLKELIGKWEGRLSTPSGDYRKASMEIGADMTGTLNVANMFKDMPVKSLSLTQSILSFDIVPYGDENLTIKFSGRIVDDVISGDAVDVSGKKGLWQFLKVPQVDLSDVSIGDVKTDSTSLDKLIGVWKGKLLEENGAISNMTLRYSLSGDGILYVENPGHKESIKLTSVAFNDQAIKFSVTPKIHDDLAITFLGRLKGRILEGQASGNDGKRAYWKLIKVSDEADKSEKAPDSSSMNYGEVCDPALDGYYEDNILLVANQIEIILPSDFQNTKYKGHLLFVDGTNAELILELNSKKPAMSLYNRKDNSTISLNIDKLSITDRVITIATSMENNPDSVVIFRGKIFGDYINGKAINPLGEELKWELIAVDKNGKPLASSRLGDYQKIKGVWKGTTDYAGLFSLSAVINLSDDKGSIAFGDQKPLDIENISLGGNNVSFVIRKNDLLGSAVTFEGTLSSNKITGTLTTLEGSRTNMSMVLCEPCAVQPLTGIWKGTILSGEASADIVFDFTTDNKKVFIDDSKAKTGRLEMPVMSFVSNDKTLTFKTKPLKATSDIDFSGGFEGDTIKGTAVSQLDGSKKLTWMVSKSNLTKYNPEEDLVADIEPQEPKYQKTFSFLDEIKERKDRMLASRTPEKDVEDTLKEDKTNEKPLKENKSNDKKSIAPAKKEKEANIKSENKENKTKKDEQFVKAKEGKDKNSIDSEKPDEKKSKKTEVVKKPTKEKKLPNDEKAKTTKKTDNKLEKVINASTMKDDKKELQEKSPEKKAKSESKLDKMLGKWIGELVNPKNEKASITLVINANESQMYVEREGKQAAFKLLEIDFDGKNVSFIIKPTKDANFGLTFKGTLKRGKLSGKAVDPSGAEGTWFAKAQ